MLHPPQRLCNNADEPPRQWVLQCGNRENRAGGVWRECADALAAASRQAGRAGCQGGELPYKEGSSNQTPLYDYKPGSPSNCCSAQAATLASLLLLLLAVSLYTAHTYLVRRPLLTYKTSFSHRTPLQSFSCPRLRRTTLLPRPSYSSSNRSVFSAGLEPVSRRCRALLWRSGWLPPAAGVMTSFSTPAQFGLRWQGRNKQHSCGFAYLAKHVKGADTKELVFGEHRRTL